ncbi:MAG: ClpXP protease specificity-enhancing factor SspB, partial [Acidobacteria bacterium]|nr:ClpXP protease specificity-enhancing factor SspB [Acidobacteriota bacterium]
MTKSQRPYLIRALHDWLLDNGHTPFLLVAAGEPGVTVPGQHVSKDGKIILNLSPKAVQGLELGNDAIKFSARFGGSPF